MMKMLFMLIGLGTLSHATDPSLNSTHASQLKWWQEQRFGMFIHWGPVAQTGGEIGWARGSAPAPVLPYDTLYKTFNPVEFDAGEWVRIAQDAGMNYMVLVAKHHDGFCEFNSALTEYDIMASPFGRDVSKELADSCHAAGMGLGFYYSPTDWYWGANNTPEYHNFYTNQVVDELLSNYGRVDVLWYDLGPVGANGTTLLNRMREKQPWVLVDNRGDTGPFADFNTPEQTIGAFDTTKPWESCMTIDGRGQWSWNPSGGVKPLRQLIDMIVGCADAGGNCLLNVGPRPDGKIDSLMVARLSEIGDFMRLYGESIYGTQGGPIRGGVWGGTTHKGDTLYVHLKPFASSNLAKGKTATQSSTDWGGEAGRAVDDNTDGVYNANSVSHTAVEAGAWWMVDLGASYSVNLIKIYGRTDCCRERLDDYSVIVLDSNQVQVWSDHQTSYPNPLTTIVAGGRTGRFVRIQLTDSNALSLAEVQVFDTTRNTMESITIPPVKATIVSAACLTGGTPVVEQDTAGITISLPVQNIDTLYSIIRMELDYSRIPTGKENVRVNGRSSDILSVHPNPFTSAVTLTLSGHENPVELAVYDIRGKMVVDLKPGFRNNGATWNAKTAAGMYVVKAEVGGRRLMKRVLLVK